MGAAVLLSQRRAAEAAQRAANSRLELRAAEQTQSVTAAKSRLTQQLVEQQQIEAALRESRQRCELDAEGADGGVWEWDVETRSAYFSPRWKGRLACRESGIEPTMAAWESRLHPDDRARALAAVAVFREGGASQFRLEHRLRHQDGSYRWISSLGSGLCDEQGRIVRMRGIHLDVTAKQHAEEARRASEERYRELVEQVGDIIDRTDAAGRCTYCNPTSLRILGYLPEELLVRHYLEIVLPPCRV